MFTNRENLTTKTPPGDFQVTTSKIPLLSKQAVTSKGIPVPYTNLQLNPYPNTQLNLFCSDNFPFRCTAFKYVTNQCADPSMRLQSPTRESCWHQNSSIYPNDENQEDAWSQNPNTATSSQEWWTRANSVSGYKLLEQTLLNTCATCVHFDDP